MGRPRVAVAHAGGGERRRAPGVLEWARTAMRASVAGARPGRAVYLRVGRPCPRCGAAIESRGQGDDNRTAYWCPACQPLPRSVSGSRGTGTDGG